jgi:ribA/ribD-fused uncharacterized protein
MKIAHGMSMFFGPEDLPSNWHIDENPFLLTDVRFDLPDGEVKVIPEVSCNCGEKAMMVYKAALFGDLETFYEILLAQHPRDIKRLGRQVGPWDENKWRQHRSPVMLQVVMSRARQNSALREWILSTGDLEIVEASPYDRIWGTGLGEDDPRIAYRPNWPGLNLLGEAYMTGRYIFRAEEGQRLCAPRQDVPALPASGSLINVNDRATVTLTQYGAQVYRRYLEDLRSPTTRNGQEIAEGQTHEFALWDLMQIFGSVYMFGMKAPSFVNNVVHVRPD